MANAPESGQPFHGRVNPWDDDDEGEKSASSHAFPTERGQPPGDDL